MVSDVLIEMLGTVFFATAVVHIFSTKLILRFSRRFSVGSAPEALFHLLSEIEVVFGLWGGLFLVTWAALRGVDPVLSFTDRVHFTEPIFVFCVMVVASTKPILWLSRELIMALSVIVSRAAKVPLVHTEFFMVLALGSISGSLITEPAAMTVSAFLLVSLLDKAPARLLYFSFAVLLVNVSIGGALTHFAAPPILMVAAKWNWDTSFVFEHFGWKSLLAVVFNSAALVFFERSSIKVTCKSLRGAIKKELIPSWVVGLHVLCLAGIVLAAHRPQNAVSLFLFFLGLTTVTQKFQDRLRLKESLLVAFFLGGIIFFGPFQKWWLQPLLETLSGTGLFFSAVLLTSVTDNAALTYLGSQVESLTEASKYYLVAGAIAGGGLTIIANAPNAAGFSILQEKFKNGFSPLSLFLAALPPTAIAVLVLKFFPHL